MQPITAQEFRDADGVADWLVIDGAASTQYRISSFTDGARFVLTIAELADAANHHPDVDLRYGAVSIRLSTHDIDGLSDLDLALAQQISEAARDAGLEKETS